MEIKVYESVAETLSRLGVERVFGLVGSGNFGLVDHMTRGCGILFHASRHEEAAVAMADGYSRASRKLEICTVYQGSGVTNTLTVLMEAVKNRTPMLLLAGDTVVRSVGAGVEHIRAASVLSPAISGVLRDSTGNWNAAVMLDAGIILASFVLLLFVREPRVRGARAGAIPGILAEGARLTEIPRESESRCAHR